MEDIYLNKEKKEYYFRDFTENVLQVTDDFWKLSESIKAHLIELNSLDKIQPLYSKFPDNRHSADRHKSYLEIAYAKDVELILLRETMSYFSIRYNQEESKFYYIFCEPKDNLMYSGEESKYKFGCFCNPNYFRINSIQFVYEDFDKDNHLKFWEDLTNKLKRL